MLNAFFISAVSNEFKSYREQLRDKLNRHPSFVAQSWHNIEETFTKEDPAFSKVFEQSDFRATGDITLLKLDYYIKKCTVVVHLIGDQAGSGEALSSDGEKKDTPNFDSLVAQYPDLQARMNLPENYLRSLTYTQWEAWLAIYHRKKLVLAKATPDAPRDNLISDPQRSLRERQSQELHISNLRDSKRRYVDFEFSSVESLLTKTLDEVFVIADFSGFASPGKGLSESNGKIHIPALKVVIAASKSRGVFTARLKRNLDEFRVDGNPGPVFIVKTIHEMHVPITSLRAELEDSWVFLFDLESPDEAVHSALEIALQCQFREQQRPPRIVGYVEGDKSKADRLRVMRGPRPATGSLGGGEGHDFGENVQELAGDAEEFCERLYDSFYPRFTVISDAADFLEPWKDQLFTQTMEMYALLIPDKKERDHPNNIKSWICDSDGNRDEWCDYLVVAHYPAGEPFAAFWCNVDLRSGLGHVPFWGARVAYRDAVIAVHLAGYALSSAVDLSARSGGAKMRAIIFEAETVDLMIMRKILARACLFLNPPRDFPLDYDPSRKREERDLLELVDRPMEDNMNSRTPLRQALLEMTENPDFAKELDETVRKFRRFYIYAHPSPLKSIIRERYGFGSYGFIHKQSVPKDHQMAVYWQPPIIGDDEYDELPVRESDACEFHLFALVNTQFETKDANHVRHFDLSGKEVVDWEYDCFLGEQFRDPVPFTGLPGWIDCLAANGDKRTAFIDSAELRVVELGASYKPAEKILRTLDDWPKGDLDSDTMNMRVPGKL